MMQNASHCQMSVTLFGPLLTVLLLFVLLCVLTYRMKNNKQYLFKISHATA